MNNRHLEQINIVNNQTLNVKKQLKQINIVNNQILNVKKTFKTNKHSKQPNIKC